jgi:hypothetical protein
VLILSKVDIRGRNSFLGTAGSSHPGFMQGNEGVTNDVDVFCVGMGSEAILLQMLKSVLLRKSIYDFSFKRNPISQ